jgi:hypothetical protein
MQSWIQVCPIAIFISFSNYLVELSHPDHDTDMHVDNHHSIFADPHQSDEDEDEDDAIFNDEPGPSTGQLLHFPSGASDGMIQVLQQIKTCLIL